MSLSFVDLEIKSRFVFTVDFISLNTSAFADVESAYWARGAIVDENLFSAQYVGLEADLNPFGRFGGYAWSVLTLPPKRRTELRQNAEQKHAKTPNG